MRETTNTTEGRRKSADYKGGDSKKSQGRSYGTLLKRERNLSRCTSFMERAVGRTPKENQEKLKTCPTRKLN